MRMPGSGGDRPHDVEESIAAWRSYIDGRAALAAPDIDELESHLRDEMDRLRASGLSSDEAFLVAVGRLGRIDDLSREFAREHSGRLWKQLVLSDAGAAPRRPGPATATVLAAGAAIAVKLPALVAGALGTPATPAVVANAVILVLSFVAAWFVWLRRPAPHVVAAIGAVYIVGSLALNLYPSADGGMTWLLTAVHLPVLLWLVSGVAYTGGDWRSPAARMDYVRFTGEWFVYVALIALGGGVLMALTTAVFSAAGVDLGRFIGEWVAPCGAAGAAVIAAWLVEAKQSVIENIAPVLTRIFTPLFALMLLAFAAATVWQPNVIDTGRELLIVFDVVLVVVLGLLLYAVSARDPLARAGWFERTQAVLVGSALVVDLLVLIAMVARIGAFGFSANKLASLGLNAILLVNLAWSMVLIVRALRGRAPYAVLERWQMAYVPVYAAWAAVVALVFPPAFGFA